MGALLQVYDVATDAGADDIVPATDEDDRLEGYKVSHTCRCLQTCACDRQLQAHLLGSLLPSLLHTSLVWCPYIVATSCFAQVQLVFLTLY